MTQVRKIRDWDKLENGGCYWFTITSDRGDRKFYSQVAVVNGNPLLINARDAVPFEEYASKVLYAQEQGPIPTAINRAHALDRAGMYEAGTAVLRAAYDELDDVQLRTRIQVLRDLDGRWNDHYAGGIQQRERERLARIGRAWPFEEKKSDLARLSEIEEKLEREDAEQEAAEEQHLMESARANQYPSFWRLLFPRRAKQEAV
jgi:hypothetical protein